MKNYHRGFSLIELVMFIVIVSIAVTAIAQIYSTNVMHSPEPLLREKALKIANFYMDEIMGKRWEENTPAGGGCIETGSNYCNNLCAAQPFPNCGFCNKSGGACVAPATIAALAANEEANRSDFDDVDDYLSGTLSATPSFPDPVGVNGETALTDVAGFTVSVAVTEVAIGGIPASDVRRVVVTVNSPVGESLTLTRYRINF